MREVVRQLDSEQIARTCVIIATKDRPATIQRLIPKLHCQTVAPNQIIVSGVSHGDVPDSVRQLEDVKLIFGSPGLTAQRNRALELLPPGTEFAIFFDDDFIPSDDWIEIVEKLFDAHPRIVGLTGRVILDGARGPGIDFETAVHHVGREPRAAPVGKPLAVECLYGCNMAFRAVVFDHESFDEQLPAYGWQEDQDISGKVRRHGSIARSEMLRGVHLGEKSGRVSGYRLGISQMINPAYLVLRGTMGIFPATRLAISNLAANILRSAFPERHVDRIGRLRGNLIGLGLLLTGRIDPTVIERDGSR